MLRFHLFLFFLLEVTAISYYVETRTSRKDDSATDESIRAKVFSYPDKGGHVRTQELGELNVARRDDFDRGAVDDFTASGADVGEIVSFIFFSLFLLNLNCIEKLVILGIYFLILIGMR